MLGIGQVECQNATVIYKKNIICYDDGGDDVVVLLSLLAIFHTGHRSARCMLIRSNIAELVTYYLAVCRPMPHT